MMKTNLAGPVRAFFEQHLLSQRGLSGHTVLAYRDTMKLLLEFACGRFRKTCTDLSVEDLSAAVVRSFMEHLERVRKNASPTRNARLAAIHSFFRYLATTDPRHIAQSQAVLAVPFKRQTSHVPEYLDREEIQKIFAEIDGQTLAGQRDDGLLRMLYNTGMRAQEVADLNVNHVRFTRPYHVLIHGKGRRERTCPLWKETVDALKTYLQRRAVRLDDGGPLFVNTDGNRLTRFGIRYIVSHRVGVAAKVCPSLLTKRISPHSFRHTTALHLLQSNVDLSMIRSWLGHASIETTNTYVEIDLEMKRKTLESCKNLIPKKSKQIASWQRDNDLLSWLSKL